MQNFLGTAILLGGLLMVLIGFIVGHSGVWVPGNVLGLYSPVTAICVFGGIVVAFVGFMLMVGKIHHGK
jgi:hypothetical protein